MTAVTPTSWRSHRSLSKPHRRTVPCTEQRASAVASNWAGGFYETDCSLNTVILMSYRGTKISTLLSGVTTASHLPPHTPSPCSPPSIPIKTTVVLFPSCQAASNCISVLLCRAVVHLLMFSSSSSWHFIINILTQQRWNIFLSDASTLLLIFPPHRLQITAVLLGKYPSMVPSAELVPLLSVLYQLLAEQRRGERGPYVLRCLKELARCQTRFLQRAQSHSAELGRLWGRVWALALRGVSSPQMETFSLDLLASIVSGGLINIDREFWKLFSASVCKLSQWVVWNYC